MSFVVLLIAVCGAVAWYRRAPPRIRHLLLEVRDEPIRLLRWAFRTAVTPFTCNRDDITKAYPKNDGLMLGKVLVFLINSTQVFSHGGEI